MSILKTMIFRFFGLNFYVSFEYPIYLIFGILIPKRIKHNVIGLDLHGKMCIHLMHNLRPYLKVLGKTFFS